MVNPEGGAAEEEKEGGAGAPHTADVRPRDKVRLSSIFIPPL